MKKISIYILLFLTSFSTFQLKADEGMWLLSLLDKLNYKDMQEKGLRLTPEQLYNVNNSSLKDACVWFNNGCTGEFISKEGLVLTNHHCGYSAITALSTPKNNILDSGFWAASKAEEKVPVKPLVVSRIVRVDDITDVMLNGLKGVSDKDKDSVTRALVNAEIKKATDGTHYKATARSMFKGNAYYIFVMEVFNDIRLVGAPPQSIGKFGGETDNWMWPRHTGDFSMFRVYANSENKPESYKSTNVPYKPLHHLKISLKGVKEGDFAMIIGFPGRTYRYEFSQVISMKTDIQNPNIVALRDIRLKAWKEQMEVDEATRLHLSDLYAGVANYWKFYDGEAQQLKHHKIAQKKAAEEYKFSKWAENKPEYKELMYQIDKVYTEYSPYALQYYYQRENIQSTFIIKIAGAMSELHDMLQAQSELKSSGLSKEAINLRKLQLDTQIMKFTAAHKSDIHNMNLFGRILNADKKIFAKMLAMYYKNIPRSQWPQFFTDLCSKIKNNDYEPVFEKFTAAIYSKSMFADTNKLAKFLNKPSLSTLMKDPAYRFYYLHNKHYKENYSEITINFYEQMETLGGKYIKGLMEMNPTTKFYPDANSSQRLTYGTVRSYNPKNGVHFNYYTTLDGVYEKYVPGDYEFHVPSRLISLYKKKNYGQYANEKGELPVAFISDNDITGGNSGSPVMDGDGNLIGLAFDGNWEAMCGNYFFDTEFKRTISVDIRYVLWLIDKYGNASHLINEMELVK